MTAEIGVMNKLAVALAADSAMTLGGPGGKTYASSDKLFQLSNSAPIGVMIYGNADFLGLPWETIIKVYRRQLGSKVFPKADDYARDLLSFLEKDGKVIDDDDEAMGLRDITTSLLFGIRLEMHRAFDQRAEAEDGLDEAAILATVAQVVTARLEIIRKKPYLVGHSDKTRDSVAKEAREAFEESIGEIFESLPMTPASKENLVECCTENIVRHNFGDLRTGIVVAGFGEDEFLPALSHYQIEGRLAKKNRLAAFERRAIGEDSNASIIPFAQREAVTTFLEGIDDSLDVFMRICSYGLFNGAFEAAFKELDSESPEIGAKIRARIAPGLEAKLTALLEEWDRRKEGFWRPVVDIVEALPKDELAAMAEALVNLTKFRRRVTPEQETVGGPIDVAVITKGDGFIWVKRKHYFDPILNPRAMARFSGGGKNV